MIGQTVSHYRILEHLGGGGMGVIYKAEDVKLSRPVALKFLPAELTRDGEARERFVHEARAASSLQHNNICVVHEIDELPDGRLFMAMEFYQGETLKKKIERGPLDIGEAVDIAGQIAQGLARAHENGIIHRDVKPANIMVTTDGVVKILDFGLAKLRGLSVITRAGWTPGTIAYMSPEQATGARVDQRTDIWSLGVTLYEMLTGRRPFSSDVEEALIYSIRNDEPVPIRKTRPEVPAALEEIWRKATAKRLDERYSSAAGLSRDLGNFQRSTGQPANLLQFLGRTFRNLKSPRVAIPAAIIFCALGASSVFFASRQSHIQKARYETLPRAIALKGMGEDIFSNVQAYRLAEEAESYIPGDTSLTKLFSRLSVPISIRTSPPGAKIFLKEYGAPDSAWHYLGNTPLEHVRTPVWFFEIRMEREGYEPVHAVTLVAAYSHNGWIPDTVQRVLDLAGSLPPGMVRIPGVPDLPGIGPVSDFFMDRYEVTNRSFKEFVDRGGYQKREYWKHPFFRNGRDVPWEAAMEEFVDQTGRPGPALWQAGDFPAGQAEYPVSGISWYEAAAYAEFAGKSLPTVYHWDIASGAQTALNHSRIFPTLVLASYNNLRGTGPVPVGSSRGVTVFGNYDMLGNVREWCFNESQRGRVTRGGAWNDVPYMFDYWSEAPAFERSPRNGFRCVRFPDPATVPVRMYQPVHAREIRDHYRDKPVSDAIFRVYRDQFTYDRTPLDARVEWVREDSANWILEKISYRAAYDDERVPAFLFRPRNVSPPYQTIMYFPAGILSSMVPSSDDIEHYRDVVDNVRILVQSGRAVFFPIYKGTFERGNDEYLRIHTGDTTHQYADYFAMVVKDFRRGVDYLETRFDVDAKRLGYFGFCWGGYTGVIISAVEPRLKVNIWKSAGFWDFSRPEVNEFNYITRVRIPTLMLNGRYDPVFPLDAAVRPMFALLGTRPEEKRLVLYETDHALPPNEFITETLDWLDRYLGPVQRY